MDYLNHFPQRCNLVKARDSDTDTDIDTAHNICEKNEDMNMTRAGEKDINIRAYYFIINVIMLLKYPKQNYWQCMNSSLFLYKKQVLLST